MIKSYYEILKISEKASKNEIKKQFKKLVKMYHPDVNSSIEAEEIFKQINKAAEILLDDEKRKKYDELRNLNVSNTYSKKNYSNSSSGYSFYDLFEKRKQENKKDKEKEKEKKIKGDDIYINVEIDYTEALLGTQRKVNITHSSICPRCNGHKFANGQKCVYCDGKGETISNRKITVKIPASIKDGTKLRIKGEGKKGKNGGENGNLYVIVKIKQNTQLYIKDNIVYYSASISPYTAVLGGNIKVPTLWGEATIKLPPLTKTNQSFKLIDVGVLNDITKKKGEQIVKIQIQIPSEISPQEFSLYEKLRDLNSKKTNGKTIFS